MKYDFGNHFKGRAYCGAVVFWRNYTYQLGPHKCKGTEYFEDKSATKLLARNPYYTQRKDRVVRINDWPVKAIRISC